MKSLAFCLLAIAAQALASGEVNNGADQLRLLFAHARESAIVMTTKIRPEDLADDRGRHVPDTAHPGAETAQTLNDWILANRLALVADVAKTLHEWSPDPADYCAVTTHGEPFATVHFSYPICRAQIQKEEAMIETVIHESIHHFGFGNEANEHKFCDDVALAISSAWQAFQITANSHWATTDLGGNPTYRGSHTAVWAKDRMIVWGGCHESDDAIFDCGTYLASGGLYDPAKDHWDLIDPTGAPRQRALHSAVWTGSKMIVWGGCDGVRDACKDSLNDGAAFDPATGKWDVLTDQAHAPSPRVYHTATWAGDRMVVWGGEKGHDNPDVTTEPLRSGGIYGPDGAWTATRLENAPTARKEHTAVWTGAHAAEPLLDNKVIVWGGCDFSPNQDYDCRNLQNTGAILDVATNTWKPMSTVDAPDPRRLHTAVWAGDRMIVWGGRGGRAHRESYLNQGGIYDPKLDKWFPMNAAAPTGRAKHAAVWTGDRMIVWGGKGKRDDRWIYPADVASYFPDLVGHGPGRWEVDGDSSLPPPTSEYPSAVWTGEAMIVWGGEAEGEAYLSSGGIYKPSQRLSRSGQLW